MPENTYSLEKTVMALWEKKRISSLRDLLLTLQPVQVAGLFEVLPEEARPLLFRLLPKETAAEVFVELDAELLQQYLQRLRLRNGARETVEQETLSTVGFLEARFHNPHDESVGH